MARPPKYPSLEETVLKLAYDKLLEEVRQKDGSRLWWLACKRLCREAPTISKAEGIDCRQLTNSDR